MAIKRAERDHQLDTVLAELTALRGVAAAAIVDSDGFVTHIRRDFEINTDALGAAVQIVLGSARKASEHVTQGDSKLVLIENKDGLTILAPLTRGFVLALAADGSAMLGAVRFEMKETIPELNRLFAA
jgi:uncharacterized protein